MTDTISTYLAEPETKAVEAVRANRLVRANLTGNVAEITRLMNLAIAEGEGALSRLAMVLAADFAVFLTADKTQEEAVYVIDGVLDFYLRDNA